MNSEIEMEASGGISDTEKDALLIQFQVGQDLLNPNFCYLILKNKIVFRNSPVCLSWMIARVILNQQIGT